MTREEAIKELSYIADEMPSMECADWKEAISMAIKALKKEPRKGHWIKEESPFGWDEHSYQCSERGRSIHLDTEMEDYPYCHCGGEDAGGEGMTKEEAIEEVNKVFEPAFANYIITALTEGATVSDKEQGTACIQAIYTEALEEGIRCAMCTNTIKSDTGCDGGCIVDVKMYNKVMTEINSRLLRKPPKTGYISIDDAMSVFNDFMCGNTNEADTETFLEMLKGRAIWE